MVVPVPPMPLLQDVEFCLLLVAQFLPYLGKALVNNPLCLRPSLEGMGVEPFHHPLEDFRYLDLLVLRQVQFS